jgi:hypothetical protein
MGSDHTAIFSAESCSKNAGDSTIIEGVGVVGGLELLSLLKYSRTKFKNQKHIAVDVLFKAYPMILLSG